MYRQGTYSDVIHVEKAAVQKESRQRERAIDKLSQTEIEESTAEQAGTFDLGLTEGRALRKVRGRVIYTSRPSLRVPDSIVS